MKYGRILLAGAIMISLAATTIESTPSCDCASLTKSEQTVNDPKTGKPFTGICTSNSKVVWFSILKKKKLNAQQLTVLNDREVLSYYENGNLKKEEEYYITGKIAALRTYIQNNGQTLLNGEMTTWHENGLVRSKGSFSKGSPIGVHQYFNHLGNLSEERTISGKSADGNLIKVMTKEYYDAKNVKTISRYSAIWNSKGEIIDKKMISVKEYSLDGTLKSEKRFDETGFRIINQTEEKKN